MHSNHRAAHARTDPAAVAEPVVSKSDKGGDTGDPNREVRAVGKLLCRTVESIPEFLHGNFQTSCSGRIILGYGQPSSVGRGDCGRDDSAH
ncbi:hypothetical protein ACFWAY_43280 [Rhodococcus sp. NPDC059968]|uniref:hypothetical protein n=1 Tax=Rhodococcus sp. NPDC059968 TaxID=3347017 RepID=UPI00366B24F0